MNSSAKSTAAFTFLAAAALGAAVFMGCTVTSDTNPDTSGDENDKDAGNNNDNDNEDAGSDSATGAVCEANITEPFANQTCLNANCCTELQGCFNLDSAGLDDCNGFDACIATCDKNADDNPDAGEDALAECYDICKSTTTPEIVTAYATLQQCSADKCTQ